jgi:hypothetical protein
MGATQSQSDIIEKRKISCPYWELKLYSSVFQPVA